MKKLILLALLASVPGILAAQAEPVVDEVRITRPIDRIELPREKRNVWPDQFDEIKGMYFLSNGNTMELSMVGNRMYARIGAMPRSQLLAVSPYVFVALDEKLKITIDDAPYGRNDAQLLMAVPRMSGTTLGTGFTRLVASR